VIILFESVISAFCSLVKEGCFLPEQTDIARRVKARNRKRRKT